MGADQLAVNRTAELVADDFRMVTFTLDYKAYAIDIMHVKEISSAKRFTYVPNTVDYVRGVFNLRGDIIPVIDMRLFLNLQVNGENCKLDVTRNNEAYEDLIILNFHYVNIAIIVDSISHVVSVDRRQIQHSHPLFSGLDVQYIEGIVEYNRQLYIILAIDQMIDPQLDPGESVSFEHTFSNIVRHRAASPDAKEAKQTVEDTDSEEPPCPAAGTAGAEQLALSVGLPAEQSVELEEPGLAVGEVCVAESPGHSALSAVLEQEGLRLTPLNAAAVQRQWEEWQKSSDISAKESLKLRHNRREFLARLRSQDSKGYWSAPLAEELSRHFRQRCGNLNVWHVGCGNGQGTYSLAAALAGAAPEANLQIRAADPDLQEVAEAPLQSVGSHTELPEWLHPYLNDVRSSSGYTFAKSLKDRIIFEYQDVIHSRPHTQADLIVVRDFLSRYAEAEQEQALAIIGQILKRQGLVVVGDNEELNAREWELLEQKPLKIYRKKVVAV